MVEFVCPNCSAVVSPLDKTCPKCGHELTPSTLQPPSLRSATDAGLPRKKNPKRVYIILGILFFTVLLFWNPQKQLLRGQIRKLADESTRAQAVEVLSRNGRAGVDLLIEAFENEDPRIQGAAKEALIQIGAPAIGPLIKTLVDTKTAPSEGAQAVLEAFGVSALDPLMDEFMSTDDMVMEWRISELLLKMGEPAIPALIQALDNEELKPSKMEQLTWTLEGIGMPVVEPLITAALMGSATLKIMAIRVLFSGYCMTSKPGEGPILICEPPEGEKLKTAAGFIASMVNDPDSGVRYFAVDSLHFMSWLGDEKNTWAVAALSDLDNSVLKSAANYFEQVRDERAIRPLGNLLYVEDPYVKSSAILALANQGTDGITAIFDAFDRSELESVISNYQTMIEAGDNSQVPLLMAALLTQPAESDVMAVVYLNCGEISLESAARKWAELHGFQVQYYESAQNPDVAWGSK